MDLARYATHTAFSDPGSHADVLASVEPQPEAIHAAATALVVHYRGQADRVTDAMRDDIDLRWLAAILDTAAARAPIVAGAPREVGEQVAGCCRDHTLVGLGVLRQHGIPARSRVGFAGYFDPGFHNDHVVVEHWDGSRWVRFDAELGTVGFDFDTRDLPQGPRAPFETAAEVWVAGRGGNLDASSYGVDRGMPWLCGMGFVRGYVFLELAHRQGDELLLWDEFGARAAGLPADVSPVGAVRDEVEADDLADEIAVLLVQADAGDEDAEAELAARYETDPRLNPRAGLVALTPHDRVGDVDLATRTTRWR
ncbi:transglutaminase-like domain-containing protein [Cellulomonas sp. PhB150]|uniref:transglutaminase-like domain-containing protein n=1 Tax=Cellulomonas sp. PhB150 TaxID=2485188 RepID=UPI000F4733DA|nr:transglutaminase-like domain-containing protein [Cellulomonas sp. PhB150]ROS23021.1 transglutaminase superfamily protein [Cellulomonas sp. PhB150]